MKPERKCTLCQEILNTKSFWDNLGLHKDCLDKVLEQVRVEPTGEVKIKGASDAKS